MKNGSDITIVQSSRFSEESGGYSAIMSNPIAGVECSGSHCDNLRLVSYQYRSQYALIYPEDTYWTDWFSDESPKTAYCRDDMLVNQVQCSGSRCDNKRLLCSKVGAGYRVSISNRMEVGFFSEEQGFRYCQDGYFLRGMECSGSYCDNVKLYCVLVELETCS